MKTIDACGISCPQPLVMLKEALKDENEITLFVDSKNTLENCVGYAERRGFAVNITNDADKYRINIKMAE